VSEKPDTAIELVEEKEKKEDVDGSTKLIDTSQQNVEDSEYAKNLKKEKDVTK